MTTRVWTKEELDILKAEYPTCFDTAELGKQLNRSVRALTIKANALGLRRPFRSIPTARQKAQEFIKKEYDNYTNKEIAEILGIRVSAVYEIAKQLGVKKDPTVIKAHAKSASSFQKGMVPHNKGKKWSSYMSAEGIKRARRTQYKKGHIPPKKQKIGYEFIDARGITWVKIADRNFRMKHRMLWEKENGPIPPDMCVVFLDKNIHNITIENLALKSKVDVMRDSDYWSYPIELRVAIGRLGKIVKTIKRQKDGKQ